MSWIREQWGFLWSWITETLAWPYSLVSKARQKVLVFTKIFLKYTKKALIWLVTFLNREKWSVISVAGILLVVWYLWKGLVYLNGLAQGLSSNIEFYLKLSFALLPLLSLLFLIWVYRKKNRDEIGKEVEVKKAGQKVVPEESLSDWLQRTNWFWLVLGWPFLIMSPLLLGSQNDPSVVRDLWWNKVLTNEVGWILIIGFTLFGMMIMKWDPKKPFKRTLGKIGILVLAIVTVWHVFGRDWWTEAKASAPPVSASETALPFLPYNKAGEEVVRAFWNEKFPDSPDDANEMVEISRRESQFNQFELDGATPYRGRINKEDVGVMQINELWLPQAKVLGHNIYTLQGNLEMAYHIRLHNGADEWNTSDEARRFNREKERTIVAPVLGWSEIIAIPRDMRVSWDSDVAVRTNSGRIYNGPGLVNIEARTEWVQFQSKTSEEVRVKYSFSPLR